MQNKFLERNEVFVLFCFVFYFRNLLFIRDKELAIYFTLLSEAATSVFHLT